MSKTLRIATRESALAMWQAEFVKAELEKHHPDLDVVLLPMKSQGDKILDTPLAKALCVAPNPYHTEGVNGIQR